MSVRRLRLDLLGLAPEIFPSSSIEIVPESPTHSAPFDARPVGVDILADCGEWVGQWNIRPDPTCPGCQAALALTADDVFGSPEPAAVVVRSPRTDDVYFKIATGLVRAAAARARRR